MKFPDDQSYLNFIKTHRPTPPESSPLLEDDLMIKIALTPQKRSRKPFLFLLGGMVGLTTIFFSVSNQIFHPKVQVSQSVSNSELEAFMTESWSYTTTPTANQPNPENDWETLVYSE